MGPQGVNETKYLKSARKLLKPQIEKHRRERINRSLETLKVLLLEGSQQQGKKNRRIEKAEILEHAVMFLKKSDKRCKGREEGFSACFQRAARFLHSKAERQQAEAVLATRLSQQRKQADGSMMVAVRACSLNTAHTTLPAHTLQLNPVCTLQSAPPIRTTSAFLFRVPAAYGNSSGVQCPQRDTPASRDCPSNRTSQSVWRPWP